MAAGRIQNRDLLQKAANDLNLEGVKRFPSVLDLNDVKAVYMVGGRFSPGLCSLAKSNGAAGQDIGGLAAVTIPIIGPDLTNPLFGASLNMDAEIASLNVRVTYDGPGSTADAGAILGFEINRQMKYGSLDPVKAVWLDYWQHVAANHLAYMWNLGNYLANAPLTSDSRIVNGEMGSRIIPEGDNMYLYVYRTQGGTWPTGTSLTVDMVVFTEVCQPQLAWDAGS